MFILSLIILLLAVAWHLKKHPLKRTPKEEDSNKEVLDPEEFITELKKDARQVPDKKIIEMMGRLHLSDPDTYTMLWWNIAEYRHHLVATFQALEPVSHLLTLEPKEKKKPS